MGEAKKKKNNVVLLKQHAPELTRQKVVNLWGVLLELQELKTGQVEFTYALARTRSHLRGEVEAIQQVIQDLEAQRMALVQECGQKKDGQVVIVDGCFQIDQDRQAEFEKKVAPILKAQNDFMKEPSDVKLHMVKMINVPVADLNNRQLEELFPMIQE